MNNLEKSVLVERIERHTLVFKDHDGLVANVSLSIKGDVEKIISSNFSVNGRTAVQVPESMLPDFVNSVDSVFYNNYVRDHSRLYTLDEVENIDVSTLYCFARENLYNVATKKLVLNGFKVHFTHSLNSYWYGQALSRLYLFVTGALGLSANIIESDRARGMYTDLIIHIDDSGFFDDFYTQYEGDDMVYFDRYKASEYIVNMWKMSCEDAVS